MKALLWKDYRLNRAILIVGLILVAGPYLLGIGLAVAPDWQPNRPALERCGNGLLLASVLSIGLAPVPLVILAGHAFAGERSDRSAEFLATLPPPRTWLLASKAAIVLGSAMAVWFVNLAVAHVAAPALGSEGFGHGRHPLFYQLPVAIILIGAAWFWSVLLDSSVFATSLGIATALIVWLGVAFVYLQTVVSGWLTYGPGGGRAEHCSLAASVIVGIAGFVAGSICYLRREAP
jgi:ABC-type transport system involved in multi-copper enzyme maturation permease subunit